MPLYEYSCSNHGVFESMGSMARSDEPASCPSCAAPADRILSKVRGSKLPAAQVKARDRNERSRHEPKVVKGQKKPQRSPGERPKLQRSHGPRPWALEHS